MRATAESVGNIQPGDRPVISIKFFDDDDAPVDVEEFDVSLTDPSGRTTWWTERNSETRRYRQGVWNLAIQHQMETLGDWVFTIETPGMEEVTTHVTVAVYVDPNPEGSPMVTHDPNNQGE